MLNEEPEKNDANFIENPDDIVGWNGIRLHSADEFRTYQHFHDEIPVKSIKKTHQLPCVKRTIATIKPSNKACQQRFNLTQQCFIEAKIFNTYLLPGRKLQNTPKKEIFEGSSKQIKGSLRRKSPLKTNPYNLFRASNLEQFLTRTKFKTRSCSMNPENSPGQGKGKKYNFLMTLLT